MSGRAAFVGEVPRHETDDPHATEAERLFGAKYTRGTFRPDGRHAWMRTVPGKITRWDVRKITGL